MEKPRASDISESTSHTLQEGMWVIHLTKPEWGEGQITRPSTGTTVYATFSEIGCKSLDLTYAKLQVVSAPTDSNGHELTLKRLAEQRVKERNAALRAEAEAVRATAAAKYARMKQFTRKKGLDVCEDDSQDGLESETARICRLERESDRHDGGRCR